jgi:flagellar hook-basal body complex protein FliE
VQEALIDGTAEVCCTKLDSVKQSSHSASKQSAAVSGKSRAVDVVTPNVKPASVSFRVMIILS